MRILVLAMDDRINSYYRAWQPMRRLALGEHSVSFQRPEGPMAPALFEHDLVFVTRIYETWMQRRLRAFKQAGLAVVWDNDDELSDVTRYRRAGGMRAQEATAGVRAMVRLADVVTTPSPLLKEQYESFGAQRVEVVENYLPDGFVGTQRERGHAGVRIGWCAAREHVYDRDVLGLRETIGELLTFYPHLSFQTIGVDLGLRGERYTHFPVVQYPSLAQALSEWDIGIAPLVDVPFNRARSNIKVKEYAAAGVPWLASPLPPYLDLGAVHGGSHVPDGAWVKAIVRLAADHAGRARLAADAVSWAAEETIGANLDRWEAVVTEAVERAQARTRTRA